MTDGTLQGPLAGLTVRLSVDGDATAETRTDEEGRYRLPLDPPPPGLAAFTEGLTASGSGGPDGSDRSGRDNGPPRRIRVEILGPADRVLARNEDPLELDHGEDLVVDVAVPARSVPGRLPGRLAGDAELRFLHGEPVDLAQAARLSIRGLREAYGYLKHPHRDASNIDLIQRAFPNTRRVWDESPFAYGECAESWGDAMRRLLAERGAPMGEHPADDLPAGAPERVFHGDRVLVRYTTDDAYPKDRVDPVPPTSDEEVVLRSGVSIGWVRHRLADLNVQNEDVAPAYVQRVALLCDHYIGALTRPPFSLPDPRGKERRLEVRIFHQHPFAATTHPSLDHVQLAPSNADEVNLRALPFVLSLRSAYRYNDTARPRGMRDAVRQGMAAMVAEMLGAAPADPGVDPNLAFPLASSLLDDADGPKKATRFTHRMWRYFARQHGVEPPSDELGTSGGFDFVRAVLEASDDSELGFESDGVRVARSGLPWWGTFDRFVGRSGDFGPEGSTEISWGNWLIANVIDGLGVSTDDSRYRLAERDASGGSSAAGDMAILGINGDLRLGRGGRRKRHIAGMAPWSARVFRIRPRRDESLRNVSVSFEASEGFDDALVQVLRVGSDGSLTEVHRFARTGFTKTIAFDGLDSVLVVVAARDAGGSFTLVFGEHAESSDVMVTPANARAGTESCVDPRAWSWTWLSPDIMVDNDDDGRADELLPFGQDNRLKVRLRNRGNARSGPVQVRFWYQRATLTPAEDAWTPVVDTTGERQELAGVRLDPDEFRWFTVPWAPADDGSGETGFLVRAEVIEPRRTSDPRPPANDDNKLATSAVKQIRPLNDPEFIDITVRSVNTGDSCGLCSVPHGPGWNAEEEGETRSDPAFGVGAVRFRFSRRGERRPFPAGAKELEPTGAYYYPIDPRTLPPGVDAEDLVTLVAHAEGEALSGLTIEIASDPMRRTIRPTEVSHASGSHHSTLLS